MPRLPELPVEDFLARLTDAFPGAVREPNGPAEWIDWTRPDDQSSFQVEWRRERGSADFTTDAHSIYLETLAELGIVGGLLLAALYGTVLAGLARGTRAAPGDPGVAAAAAVLAAFAIHAGVDWDWEMPAATLPALIMAAMAVQSRPRMDP